MSIELFLAQELTIGRGQIITAIILAVVGLIVAQLFGAFRSRSVLGPERFDPTDQPMWLWMLVMLALAVPVLVQIIYAAVLRVPQTLPPRDVIVLSAFVPAISAIALVFADRAAFRDGVRKIGLSRFSRGLLIGLIGAIVAVSLTLAAATASQWVSLQFNFPMPQEHVLLSMLHDQASPLLRGLIVFAAVVGAPVFEELMFRGHLQSAIVHTLRIAQSRDSKLARWLGIILAAAAFASVHNSGPGARWMLPPLFLLAICFGYVYERTGNLWAPIIMHAAFNGVSIVAALSQ